MALLIMRGGKKLAMGNNNEFGLDTVAETLVVVPILLFFHNKLPTNF